MSGTPEGARKGAPQAEATRITRYGEDYHSRIGSLGGAKAKGRKLSKEHKRRIGEAQKRRQAKSREETQ